MFSLCPAHLWVLVMLTVTASFHFCSLRITKTLKESFPGSCPPKNQLLKGRCGFETLTRHLSASLNTYTRIKKLTTTARVCSSVWKKLEMCFNNAIRSHHIWGYGQAQPARARSQPCCWWLNLTGPVCSWQGEHRCFLSMSPMFYAATIQLFTGVPDIPVHYVWFFLSAHLNFRNIQQKVAQCMLLLLLVPGYLLPSGFFRWRREQIVDWRSGCLLPQASSLYTHACEWKLSTYKQNKILHHHSSNKLFLLEEAYVQPYKCGRLLEMPAIRDSIFL